MFSAHDSDAATEPPTWPAPAGSTPVVDIAAPASHTAPSRSGRRRLALAAVAVLTIAGGTARWRAGRHSKQSRPWLQQTTTGSFDTTSVGAVHRDRRCRRQVRRLGPHRQGAARRRQHQRHAERRTRSRHRFHHHHRWADRHQRARRRGRHLDRGRVLRRFDRPGQGARRRPHRRPRRDQGRQDRPHRAAARQVVRPEDRRAGRRHRQRAGI